MLFNLMGKVLAVKDGPLWPINDQGPSTSAQIQNSQVHVLSLISISSSSPSLSSLSTLPFKQTPYQTIKTDIHNSYNLIISSIPVCHRLSLSCKPHWGACDSARMPFSSGQPFEYSNRPSTILSPFDCFPARLSGSRIPIQPEQHLSHSSVL